MVENDLWIALTTSLVFAAADFVGSDFHCLLEIILATAFLYSCNKIIHALVGTAGTSESVIWNIAIYTIFLV
jgi:hypothetical protein